MKIIGLNHGEINSSASILIEEKKLAGAIEERFNREKFTKKFPFYALKFVLESTNNKLEDCDAIGQGWYPGINWIKFNPIYSENRDLREKYFYTIPDHLFKFAPSRIPGNYAKLSLEASSKMPNIFFIKHHLCHAANAFFLSNFEESAIITSDFRGEIESTTMSFGKKNNIKNIQSQYAPDSLGIFYSTFTELLGYKPDSDEWKVMAMSSYEAKDQNIINKIKKTYELNGDGSVQFDQSFFKSSILERPNLYTEKLFRYLGGDKSSKNINSDWHKAIAYGMQFCAEEIALHIINKLYDKTKCKNLVASGGFFMNSVLNGKILEKTKFKNLYIPFAPTDAGNSIGSTLYIAHCIFNKPRKKIDNKSFIGPSFSKNLVSNTLNSKFIKYKKIKNDDSKIIAHLIHESKILAFFDGKMEFGDRALGNRSILADPRDSEIKDKINSAIKFREAFRPFAPVVIEERVSQYFEVKKEFKNQYMEKVVKVKKKYAKKIPAVVHFDGSCRVQTVNKIREPKLYKILLEFEKITGLPILLNTSFNLNGEPIVHSPEDAISTFYKSGLKLMILENHLIKK
jgi:carbamoyltransferase